MKTVEALETVLATLVVVCGLHRDMDIPLSSVCVGNEVVTLRMGVRLPFRGAVRLVSDADLGDSVRVTLAAGGEGETYVDAGDWTGALLGAYTEAKTQAVHKLQRTGGELTRRRWAHYKEQRHDNED